MEKRETASIGDAYIKKAEILCRWDHSSGTNGPHLRKSVIQAARRYEKLDELDQLKIEVSSNNRIDHGVTLNDIDKERRHIQRKLGETGETHSRRAKGHLRR
jgi:hypothetical protein